MAAYQKWVIMRHDVYSRLCEGAGPPAEPAVPAEALAAEPDTQHGQAAATGIQALQTMFASNDNISWAGDRLSLYAHDTGRQASKVFAALNSKYGTISVPEKIILQSGKRQHFVKAGLVNVWNKMKIFRRYNRHKYAANLAKNTL
jgi:hypothetical protein